MVLAKNPESSVFELKDKMFVHLNGWQHYAFSIFVFNSNFELLLQQRSSSKYHSGGLWTNTCCSHPLETEIKLVEKEALVRLTEEMGFTCPIDYSFTFEYIANCGNNLIENEIDFVFVGFSDQIPVPNPEEVQSFKWISLPKLKEEINNKPSEFTEWLKIIINQNYSTLESWQHKMKKAQH